MADPLDLTYDDYQDIITYCRESRWSEFIQSQIDNRLKKYYRDNPKMITYLLTQIEKENDQGKVSLDSTAYDPYGDSIPIDIWFYDESYYDSPNPEIQWLYDYLNFLLWHNDVVNEIIFPKVVKEQLEDKNDVAKPDFQEQNKSQIAKISFGIKELYRDNIIKILQEINEDIKIYREQDFPINFATILTSRNVEESSLNPKFYIDCQTNLFVHIIDELKGTFKVSVNDYFFDNSCVIYTRSSRRLSSSNIQSARHRNTLKINPPNFDLVSAICSRNASRQ